MYFDAAAFVRYNFRAFFNTRGQHYRLTPRRFLVLVIWLALYIPAQIINRICFLLDEIFYPRYRQQEIRSPIFIIGNPRSGTTFLHRLMVKDTDSFTAFTVWELMFAPSITQRKLIWALDRLGRWLGRPLSRSASAANRLLKHFKLNQAHVINLNEAEEDEHILILAWTSESLGSLYPYRDELLPYFLFDRDVPREKQHQVMGFYRNMNQRHLYAHGGNKILLSKNPSHSAKLAALNETFPDARFINLVRTPFEAMPSMLDYMAIGWSLFCDPLEPYPFKDEFFKVMKVYYLYPAEYFQDKPERCNFIKYEDLVQQPDEIVKDLYSWLKLDFVEKFQAVVARETKNARKYRSGHAYSIEKMGLSEEQIFREFAEVFSYYEFDSHQLEMPEEGAFWRFKNWPQQWKTQRMQRRRKWKIQRIARMELRRSKKGKSILLGGFRGPGLERI